MSETTLECPKCSSVNLIPMQPRNPLTHRPGVMCLDCSAFFEEAALDGADPEPAPECDHIHERVPEEDEHDYLADGEDAEVSWILNDFCPRCGTPLTKEGE